MFVGCCSHGSLTTFEWCHCVSATVEHKQPPHTYICMYIHRYMQAYTHAQCPLNVHHFIFIINAAHLLTNTRIQFRYMYLTIIVQMYVATYVALLQLLPLPNAYLAWLPFECYLYRSALTALGLTLINFYTCTQHFYDLM